MNTPFHDTKLTTQLEIISKLSLETYVNVKLNIAATYQSLATEMLEKNFLQWQEMYWYDDNYRIYQVASGVEHIIGYYMQRPLKNTAESYLVVASDLSHAALYHCNSEKYIIARRYFFKQADVEDVVQTFQNWLLAVPESPDRPYDFDAESKNKTLNVYDLESVSDDEGEGEQK